MAVRKCLTPPKIGVDGMASTHSGPRVWNRMKAPGARSTSAPGRSQLTRVAVGASGSDSGNSACLRRRRPQQLHLGGRRRLVPVPAQVLEVVVLVVEVAQDVGAGPRDGRIPQPGPVQKEDDRSEHQHCLLYTSD